MPFHSGGSTSSRNTYMLGNALRSACRAAKKRLFELAAERLQSTPDQLETRSGGVFVKGEGGKRVKFVELFAGFRGDRPGGYGTYTKGGEILGEEAWVQINTPEDIETGQIDPEDASRGMRLVACWTYGAKAVEVAVNVDTWQVKVLRFGSAADMGRPINPKMCEQQMDGGMGMGIGDSLLEEMIIEKGIVRNANFADYRVPSTIQMPLIDDIKMVFAPVPHKDGPFGAKGIGEVALVGIQPAIANAIYDAVGVRIKDLPITAERVLRALKESSE